LHLHKMVVLEREAPQIRQCPLRARANRRVNQVLKRRIRELLRSDEQSCWRGLIAGEDGE